MIHVFNGPIEPTMLSEFEKGKGNKTVFTGITTKRKVAYHEDGRRFVDGKIEDVQSVSSLWSTALARSVAQDLKGKSDEDLTLQNLGFVQYVYSVLQKVTEQSRERTTYALIALNIVLVLLFLYIFVF